MAMAQLLIYLLKGIYVVCPVLAISSLLWWFFGDIGFVGFVLFWVFGFAGMFAGGLAKQLVERNKNSFTFHAGNAVSTTLAAFYEIEAKADLPGLGHVKEDVLALINDREKTAISINEEKMDPRELIWLLISNVADRKLCSGKYHTYRGTLNMIGQQLLQVFTTASRQMVHYGLHTETEYEADSQRLKRELASIG
jgi:hypothetical protein